MCTTRKTLSLGDWPEATGNSAITIKPKAASHMFPHLPASTQAPLLNKVFCFASTCVSSNNSSLSVRQEPFFGPGKSPPSCNTLSLLESDVYSRSAILLVLQMKELGMDRGHRAGINASFLLLWEMSREEKARKGLKWEETLCPLNTIF